MSTRDELNTRAGEDFPDNNSKFISPKKLRDYVIEQNNSTANLEDEIAELSGGVVKNYDPTKLYKAGDGVLFSGSIFEANVDISTPEAFNPVKWEQRTGFSTASEYGFTIWDSVTPYVVDDLVEDDAKLYKSIQNGTNKKPNLNPTYWQEVSANNGAFGNTWIASLYLQNQVISHPSTRILYYLDVDTSTTPYTSTDLDAEIIAGDWVFVPSIKGTPNNTLRLNSLGLPEESSAFQNDGTDITIQNILNQLGDIVLSNGGIIRSSGNTSQLEFNTSLDNDVLASSDNGAFLEGFNYVGSSISFFGYNRGSNFLQLDTLNDSVHWLGFEFVSPSRGVWEAWDNASTTVTGSAKDFSPISIGNVNTIISGVDNGLVVGTSQTLSEDNTIQGQRGIIDEHLKFLQDPAGDLDFDDLSVIPKIYADNVTNKIESTGVRSGGALTINVDNTKWDLAAGTAVLIDNSAPPISTKKVLGWTAQSALAVTNLLTDLRTNLAITDDNTAETDVSFAVSFTGTVNGVSATLYIAQKSAAKFTPKQRRKYAELGRLVHPNLTDLANTVDLQASTIAIMSTIKDLQEVESPRNVEGNLFTPSAGINLSVDVSVGKGFRFDSNFIVDPENPNIQDMAAAAVTSLFYRYRDGSGGFTQETSTTVLKPNSYDDGDGTLGTVPTGKWTIQPVYRFAGSGTIISQYGQQIFNSLNSAIAALPLLNTECDDNLVDDAVFRGYFIIQEGATDTNDAATYLWFPPLGEKNSISRDVTFNEPDSLQYQLGTTISSGAAVSGFVIIGNEILWNVVGSGSGVSKIGYWSGIVPASYLSNGTFKIDRRTTDHIGLTTFTLSVYVNGVVDANMNAINIKPSASNVFELLEIDFDTALAPGDNINARIDYTGDNGDDIDVKKLWIDFNG